MRRQSGRHLNTDYYIEIELLPDREYFSPSDIAKRRFDKKTHGESYRKMFHSIYQFGVRNGLPLFPDNCARHPNGKPILLESGKAKLLAGERSAKWTGETWKSKLYSDDREAIRNYARMQLLETLQQYLRKRLQMHETTQKSSKKLKPTLKLKKSLWVAALVAAIFFTAGGIYNYSYLSEGYGVLRNDGPKAAYEFFQNRGESYDNLFGKAWAAFRNGEYDRAEKLAHKVLKSRANKDRAKGFYLLGNLDIKRGEFDQAQEHLQTAEAIYASLGNTQSLYRTRLVQAKMYLDLKDLDNALYYANLAGQIPQAQEDEYFYYIQSQIAFLFSDFEAAFNFAMQRKKVFSGDRSQLPSIYGDIGFYSGLLGNLDHCLEFTVKAESVASEQKNEKEMMFNNVNMCLYLKCSLKDYSDLRGSILTYARENKEVKLMEWMYFVDKFTCPLETVGSGDPPPPDRIGTGDLPPSGEINVENNGQPSQNEEN